MENERDLWDPNFLQAENKLKKLLSYKYSHFLRKKKYTQSTVPPPREKDQEMRGAMRQRTPLRDSQWAVTKEHSLCLQKGELTYIYIYIYIYMARGRIATDQQFCEFPVLCLFNGDICSQYPTSVKLLRPSRIPEGNTMQLPPLIFFNTFYFLEHSSETSQGERKCGGKG